MATILAKTMPKLAPSLVMAHLTLGKSFSFDCLILSSSSSEFALHVPSERFACSTAVFILHHLVPVIPTSAILKKGNPQQVNIWDLLLALAKESRFYVSFKERSNRSKVTCPKSQARWSMMGIDMIELMMFGSRV
jgi:hypothetical protein